MDETVLYDKFAVARRDAIALTDLYNDAAPDDANRTERWKCVVRQTESARVLLERWLHLGKLADAERSQAVARHTLGRLSPYSRN